jgi:hypothetical protein
LDLIFLPEGLVGDRIPPGSALAQSSAVKWHTQEDLILRSTLDVQKPPGKFFMEFSVVE